MSVLCRFARRAQHFLHGAAWRKDLRLEESPCVLGPISMQYSDVSRGALAWKGSCTDLPSRSVASNVLLEFDFVPVRALLSVYDGGKAAVPGFVHKANDIRTEKHWETMLNAYTRQFL